VLLHNGGSCNACTIKRSIILLCILKQSTWQNGAVPQLQLTLNSYLNHFKPFWVINHAWFWVNIISQKVSFFQTEQNDDVFIKFQTFHVPVVWKGCFIVHLFGNAPICASIVLECSCCRIHCYVAAPLHSCCWAADDRLAGTAYPLQLPSPA
jgi:hypothetical protein